MNTETTENIKGYIFYDAECAFCTAWVHRLHWWVVDAGFHFVPIQAKWALKTLGADGPNEIGEMKLLLLDGSVCGGVDAWIQITRTIWLFYPLSILLRAPGINQLAKIAYRKIARNRHCIAGVCRVQNQYQDRYGYVRRAFLEFIY